MVDVLAPLQLDHALCLAAEGFRVFPLVEREKLPAIDDFPSRASTDPRRIEGWWTDATGEPEARNIGISTGQGLVVIDFDMKAGQHGAQSMFDLVDMQGLPETRTVRTASGGVHLYYRTPPGCRVANSVGKIARNTDVRGEGGYVVAPGSETAAGAYRVEDPRPIADAPAWLLERCGQARERLVGAAPLVDLDTPEAIARASDWLRHHATPSFKGAGGDQAAYKAAAGVKDFGVSETMALELLLEHWNERGAPQWSPERLQVKVENAYAYGSSPAGSVSADAEFGALPPVPEGGEPLKAKAPRLNRIGLFAAADLACAELAVPLVEGLLDRGAMSVIYGDSNTGKTFVAIDLAVAVATGRPWNAKRTRKGAVVYVVAEGGRGINKRAAAIIRKQGLRPEETALDLIVQPVNLLRGDADLKALIAEVKAAGEALGHPVELVVLDTLSRVLAGGDENSSVDMGALVRNLDRLREATGAHVALVHHTGKDKARGARGHSLLRAATDTELEIAAGKLSATKQRDIEGGFSIGFSLESVHVGDGPDGRPVHSAVVTWQSASEFEALPVTGAAAEAVEAFGDWRDQVAKLAAMERIDLRTYRCRTSEVLAFFDDPARVGAKPGKRTVERWVQQWKAAGLVSPAQKGVWSLCDPPSANDPPASA